MSREIKFRAWDIDCHRFEYFEIGENDDCYGMFRVAANKFGSAIEQYTGLTDKNGKEIYEGDIVKKYDDGDIAPIIGVVEFCKSGARFGVGGGRLLLSQRWEVIGNIHES